MEAAHIVSPDKRWGMIYDEGTLERAIRIDADVDVDFYDLDADDGRETFECQCGRSIWISSPSDSGGRWFLSWSVPSGDLE
jgi:hypothetical protein